MHYLCSGNKEEGFIIKAIISIDNIRSDSKLIVLSGEPLDEPAIARGPFVMNTQEELKEAMLDYREGNFGTDKF